MIKSFFDIYNMLLSKYTPNGSKDLAVEREFRMLMFGTDDDIDFDNIFTGLSGTVSNIRNYMLFLLKPNKYRPVAIPRLFKMPTHIFRQSSYITTVTSATGYFSLFWSPRFTLPTVYMDILYYNNIDANKSSNLSGWISGYQKFVGNSFLEMGYEVTMDRFQLISAKLTFRYDAGLQDSGGVTMVGVLPYEKSAIHYTGLVGRTSSQMNNMYYSSRMYGQGEICLRYLPTQTSDFDFVSSDDYNKGHDLGYWIYCDGLQGARLVSNNAAIIIETECYYEWTPPSDHNLFYPQQHDNSGECLDETHVDLFNKMLVGGGVADDDVAHKLMGNVREARFGGDPSYTSMIDVKNKKLVNSSERGDTVASYLIN